MKHECVVDACWRPTQDHLCQGCLTELVTALRMLAYKVNQRGERRPGLCQDLDDVITRQTAMGKAVGGKATGQRLPYHVEASELADTARNIITTWARDFHESNPHLKPKWTSLASAAEWLASLPRLLSIHPAAKEMHDEITYLERAIRKMVDRAPDKIYLGKCGATFEDVECKDGLFGVVDQEVVRCKTCGTEHDAHDRWEKIQVKVRMSFASASEISGTLAHFYGKQINVKTIRSWADRDVIKTYKTKEGDKHLVGEVLDTAEKRKPRRSA